MALENFRRKLDALGKTQADIAALLNVDIRTVQRFLAGYTPLTLRILSAAPELFDAIKEDALAGNIPAINPAERKRAQKAKPDLNTT